MSKEKISWGPRKEMTPEEHEERERFHSLLRSKDEILSKLTPEERRKLKEIQDQIDEIYIEARECKEE